MNIKRIWVIVLIFCQCITMIACQSGATDKNGAAVYQVSDYDIWITVPNDWEEVATKNMDLQLKTDGMYLSAWAFSKLDLSEGQSVQDYFLKTNDSVLSLRDNVEELNPVSVMEVGDKTVYSVLCSAERDGVKNYYKFYFIEFESVDDLAWILFSGIPSVVEHNTDGINDIISKISNTNPNPIN